MNYNIDEKKVKLFRKLARKSPSAIKKIRAIYLDSELDGIDSFNHYDLIAREIKKDVRNMSIRSLLTYWVDICNADAYVLPKKVINSLTDNEKITLDI